MDDDESVIWTGIASAAAVGAGMLARKALAKAWSAKRGVVPDQPGDGTVSWREAAVFAVVSGATVGLARLMADRLVALAQLRKAEQTTA
jgi:hypothetical protein